MSSIEISDDDDSFVQPQHFDQLDASEYQDSISLNSKNEPTEVLSVSSDTEDYYTSDDELPAVNVTSKKSSAIKNLFPELQNKQPCKQTPSTSKVKQVKKQMPSISLAPQEPKVPGFERMIGGVKVVLPVEPYGSQIALMSKVIAAIKNGQNCLLESPTGSGKTLALLCAALAWQGQEKNRIAQTQAQQYFSHHPELSGVEGVVDYIASPQNKNVTPEKLFGKSVFGEKSIYDKPVQNAGSDGCNKRQEPLPCEESPSSAQVTLHKKRKLNGSAGSSATSPVLPSTPEKTTTVPQPETPESVRNLYGLINNLQLRTSMLVNCSLPTIYYGARTHKQIQQVVKEFSRTAYCGETLMTILASRDYACVREFDKQQWGTKNDMCRGCTKTYIPKDSNVPKSNCEFFDNRQALNHKSLPPAFDLEDLVTAGTEIIACPYYAARIMSATANIVFCPYNYLIEPGIRSSLQIDLHDNIVVIDEAHNIEDICRDAATFSFTRDNIGAALKELKESADSRYANQDVMSYIERLVHFMRSWDDWFVNQLPLVNNKPLNNNEAVFTWQIDSFIQTLNNHNIGQHHYNEFRESSEIFCRRYRESPETLYGITQVTGNLIESMDTVLGYLFRDSGKHTADFTPALVRTMQGSMDSSNARGWRNSQFNQTIEKETLSLRMMCMNPAVVFESLKTAKCILLASGTLTPLISLHSELDTEFPLQVSPNHVIPRDRVWIGTLTTCPSGRPLECNSRGTDQPDIQDGLGQAILWVCQVTPHGVLCFLPSYMLMSKLHKRWRETGLWHQLNELKHVFMESRNVRDHNDIMDDYYKYVSTSKGALLFAVYRGKVSEGMDFKDQQARAVVTVGVPYPNTFDMAVKEKMNYNDKYAAKKKLLSSREWLRVQAYRALNQAVGRCVRHRGDWGAVLLIDSRFASNYYTEHLSKWVRNFLGNNHYTYERLVNSDDSLESFMQNMTIRENEEV